MNRHLAVLLAASFGFLTTAFNAVADPIEITVLSSRPDMVTGGNALVQVGTNHGQIGKLRVTLNGNDITSAFKPASQPDTLMGLVTGLNPGGNTLRAQSNGGNDSPSVTLTNYPITGPVFSGPHETPFICQTSGFKIIPGSAAPALGAALDANCSIATRVDYAYMTTAGTFKPFTPGGAYPADLVTTTTTEGKTVNYIVRVETGTINRGIYQTAILHDPNKEQPPTPFNPPASWNHKLVYTFGGGCVRGWYIQGSSIGNSNGVLEDLQLKQGYAVASNSLNVFGNNCNDVLAAETLMMVKERFIENFGPVKFTIGWGCSAGSEQQQTAIDEFPGLMDGIVVGCSFIDPTSDLTIPYVDADLVNHYIANTSVPWTDTEKLAMAGFPNDMSLLDAGNRIGALHKTQPVNPSTPSVAINANCPAVDASIVFDPVRNPSGTVRCDFYDHMKNIFGTDPNTGYARRVFDNVGVQYGLKALNAGQISKAQFIDLNQHIGGYDNNGNYTSTRAIGDANALRIAYQTDRVVNTGLGGKMTPIIDYRAYMDLIGTSLDTHQREQGFMMRARLLAANGNFDNQVMVVEEPIYGNFSDTSPLVQQTLTQMDQWLTNLAADQSNANPRVKLNRAKPADLVEACFTHPSGPSGSSVKYPETQVYSGNTFCNSLYPAHASPRDIAGGPLANDLLKCQLKPLDVADYTGVTFTPPEIGQLMTIFPNGVCDWSKPGVGQQRPDGTWIGFGD